jgi:hypothetical protein
MASLSWRATPRLCSAEGGEAFDALGAALLDAFDFVDLVVDEVEEAGHHLAEGGVEGGQGVGDGGLELGALVGVVDHAQEGAVGVAALGVPGGLVVGVQLALAVAVLGVAVDGLVEGGGGLLDHGAVLADVGDEAFHLQGDGAGLVVAVGDVGLGTLAGVELVEFNVAGGDFGFDVLADAGGVVVNPQRDLLEAGGDAGDGAAGGDGVLAAHTAQEVQRPAGVLGQIADVLAVAFVHDAVQPALAGPGLHQRKPGLRVIEICEVALEPHDELGLGNRPVADVTFHQRRVDAEVSRGEQADGTGAVQATAELDPLGRRQPCVVVVHLRSSI